MNVPADALVSFLGALRPPLEYLSRLPKARTRFPAARLADRGRAVAGALEGQAARLIEELCAEVEGLEELAGTARAKAARRCLALIGQLEGMNPSRSSGPAGVAKDGPGPTAPAAAPGGRRGATAPPMVRADDPAALEPYRPSEGHAAAALQSLERPVQFARGVGPRRAEILRKFGIRTVYDLLFHLPFRYEDRRCVRTIRELVAGEEACVIGEITHLDERTVGRKRRTILDGTLRDATGLLGLTWYHHAAHYRGRLPMGRRLLVYGRVETGPTGVLRMVHPEVSLSPGAAGQGIVPVYGKPAGVSAGVMRAIVRDAVDEMAQLVPSRLPAEVGAAAGVMPLADALLAVHRPSAGADLAALNAFSSHAHRSLAFDELFFLQIGLLLRRRACAGERGLTVRRNGRLSDAIERRLPFALTGAQRRVLGEALADMASGHPMNRLVHGDVGSGKTAVALLAAAVAVENGLQAAFMAPTELLAEQHLATIEKMAHGSGLRLQLLTGSANRAGKERTRAAIAAGEVDVVVGTHALVREGVRFWRLGLAVIDEQHRFGVMQRAALLGLAADGRAPHVLLMSATPIPRTLALTLYGDLDVSVLDELPAGRRPVTTELLDEGRRPHAYERVKAELAAGRQAYVVFPLVEESQTQDLRDAAGMARELARSVFAGWRVGLLHGRMKAEEKDAVMRRFRAGDLQVLVSTTVVEVGVDVPNASVMVVEHAERFGLAQLHQLRGRVGRGPAASYCFLVARFAPGDAVHRRLSAVARTADGFELAEIDLRERGPGDFLGTRQSGLPDLRVANLVRDSRMLVEARRAAERWLERDPELRDPESVAMLEVLRRRWAERLGLAAVG